MLSRSLRLSAVLAAALALAGCSQLFSEAPGDLIASGRQRADPSDDVSPDVGELSADNTDFGVALYRQVAKPGENLFFSPLSITQAFAMVYAGARGNTEQQMQQTLRFSLPQERLHPAMNALDQTLHSRTVAQPGQANAPELRMVNAIWGQQGFAFEQPYLDTLAVHYGAGMRAVDFTRDPESLRRQINAWVEDQTNSRIKDLLAEGQVNVATRLMLVNALYFKGLWAQPFDPELTKDRPFHLADGTTRSIPMMRQNRQVDTLRGDGFQALALPYKGGALRMLAVLPDAGRFGEVEARLSGGFLDTVRKGLKEESRMLLFPKFQLEQELDLTEVLPAMGMSDAFSDSAANFQGISQQEQLVIGAAQHKAFIGTTELGTEAAAATGIGIELVSAPPLLALDRPFLFFIEDRETKAVLFLGRLMNP
jgi:serpin B